MAKRREGRGRDKQPKKTPRVPAYKELVAILKKGSYYAKVYIIMQLKAAGYKVDENSVSYVMTSARQHGHLCVYAPKQGYTASPNGKEALVDIRKRRRISDAWLRNVKALVVYVRKNWKSLAAQLDPEVISELKRELSYHSEAIVSNDKLKEKYNLS